MKQIKNSILITGCSSGIGYYVAKMLRQKNYRVFATARKLADVQRLSNKGFEAYQLDLNKSQSIQACYQEILTANKGQLYALFNNGAYGQVGAIQDINREILRKQFETNVFGWHELTNLALTTMRQQGYGRIIQNSSILGFMPMRFRGAYCASKYAIEALSDTLRLELHNSNIHISLIEPGPISSRFRKNCMQHFTDNIDITTSSYQTSYQKQIDRMQKNRSPTPFTLPPHAVYKKVLKALEHKKPKPRYYVCFPTYLFGYLKRVLSSRAFDRLLTKI